MCPPCGCASCRISASTDWSPTDLHAIPDEGRIIELGGAKLYYLPAHFLHSEGNFQLYDPTSKILYSGDLGASHRPELP